MATRDELERLQEELQSVKRPTDWHDLETWGIRARFLIQRHFAQYLPEFDKYVSEPSWVMSPFTTSNAERVEAIDREFNQQITERARIKLEEFLRGLVTVELNQQERKIPPVNSLKTLSQSILFLDVSNWSKLTHERIYRYVTDAMPKIQPLLDNAVMVNTWGDAIVATFDSARSAAKTALNIRDLFRKGDPLDGIPEGLNCRIALHHGEVMIIHNPILQKPDIFGESVHLAARLEPKTDVGMVFCTEAFAQQLQSLREMAPQVHPRGVIDLPKGAGTINVYAVTWRNEENPGPKPNTP